MDICDGDEYFAVNVLFTDVQLFVWVKRWIAKILSIGQLLILIWLLKHIFCIHQSCIFEWKLSRIDLKAQF